MSSPAFSPAFPPPTDSAPSPFLPLLPTGKPITSPSPLSLPPVAVITPPFISPPAPLPAAISPAPSLPLIPTVTPPPQSPPQAPIISPPAPVLPVNPPAPILPSSPPTPAVSETPPVAPTISTKPQQPLVSSPATNPPKRTKFRHSFPSHASSPSHSRTTTAIPPPAEPVAAPATQPVIGGSTGEGMPLTAEMPSPQPSMPLVVENGGSRPAMAVLPVGANGSSDLRADTAGSGGNGNPVSNVSTGIIAGLCVGGVVLVALLVFGVLLVVCRRRKKGSSSRFDDCGGSFACNSKSTFQGKLSLPSYTKRNTSFPDTEIRGATNNPHNQPPIAYNRGLGLDNPDFAMALPVPSTGTFTYEELVAATSGFSVSNLLGQGGFGFVHKGVLPNGKEVAVKQLKMGGQQGEREFRAEVETISQVHHKHLVSLVGYCIAGVERLLVYEFVTNKTLEFHLHDKNQPVMNWNTRLKIAIGSAKGLAYLHEDCNPTIIHRDIKASNILLDFNCEAKLSDFGLAKIFSNTESAVTHITTRVMGTFGYLAPEYASSGKVTDKSDVYSYGVMLLELITGRPPINTLESDTNGSLVIWARPLLPQAIEEGNFDTLVDSRLQNNYNVNEMANMVACAAACVRLSAWRRPRMSQVIRALEGDLSPSDLDDGVRPGHSSMQFPYESLDFDAQKYMEDMKKFRIALSSNNGVDYSTGRYSENTSEYGLQPSISSADSHESNTKSFELGRH